MNERKLRAALSGVAACVVLGAFLIGVPACLVRLVGNPLPTALPAWSSVTAAVESGVLPPGVAIRVVALVVWIWWSQAALSFIAEVAAACRGRAARRMPLGALGVQPLVAWLVTVAVTAAGTLGLLSQPILAATPSFAGVSVPVAAEQAAPGSDATIVGIPAAGAPSGSAPSGSALSGSAPPGAASLPTPPAPILAPALGVSTAAPAPPAPVADATAPILAPAEPAVTPAVRSVAPPVPAIEPVARDGSPVAARSLDAPAAAGGRAPGGGSTRDIPPAPGASDVPGAWTRPEAIAPTPRPAVAAEASPAAERASAGIGELAGIGEPAQMGESAPMGESAQMGESGEPAQIGASGWVVVKPGDSLWVLAEKHLGDALAWQDIYDLNAGPLPGGGTLRDPNLIYPGWRLRLPAVAADPSSPPPAGAPDPAPNPAGPPPQGPG